MHVYLQPNVSIPEPGDNGRGCVEQGSRSGRFDAGNRKDNSPSINSEVCSCDISASVTEQVDHGTLQVFGGSHLADGNQRCPSLVKLRIVIEYFPSPTK